MSPVLGLVLLASTLASESYGHVKYLHSSRLIRALGKANQADCFYEGRRYTPGASVKTREACLACVCTHGALSCRRRSCEPLPEPPPRCHVIHRRGECCPELRCPDGVKRHGALARFEDTDIDTPSSNGHACVEGGTVYTAGSAMTSSTACEQCFCLGGIRRCVSPRCLPPPPGCQARPAPGSCCPQRYYCEHIASKPPDESNQYDCVTPEGTWAMEGQRVKAAEVALKCVQCFCLRGSIRCQSLSCAPALQGCRPLVQPGQCCPHQYQCDRHNNGTKSENSYIQEQNSLRDKERSFHTSKSSKRETTLQGLNTVTDISTVAVTVTKKDLVTNKVKRNTDEPAVTSSSTKSEKNDNSSVTTVQMTQKFTDITSTLATETTTFEETTEELFTEQPEGSVKVIINGTINCTAELSSTSLLLNVSNENDTVWIDSQTQPRIPIINTNALDSHTFPPNDIITEGFHNDRYDEKETFTINVTSSLRTNTTQSSTSTIKPSSTIPKTVSPALLGKVNVSKIKKEDYDYDYTEPTLPPSLPNLKIIPFVAADAVVEDDISLKENLDYTILNREDKYPVYYPNKETKKTVYDTLKEDVFNPTQYPIFISKKIETQFPNLNRQTDANVVYSSITNSVPSAVKEYTVTASLGNSVKTNKKPEKELSSSNTKFEVEPPAFNLFSPPVKTEGGFIPKGPEIIDDYYSVYSSTPTGFILPHLTTSMQLEPKDECISSDGRHVSDGSSISLACSICTCAWGDLHCSPRPCHTPSGCKRRDISISVTDICCGELICDEENTTIMPLNINHNDEQDINNESKILNKSEDDFSLSQVDKTNSSYMANNQTYNEIFSVSLNQSSNTEQPILYITSTEKPNEEMLGNFNNSQEYEDEDEDEGFSLGNVLKLLLSETYETTTFAPRRKLSTATTNTSPKTVLTTLVPTIKPAPSENGFVPVTHRFPYIPPKRLYAQNPVNRIDHLVLGEPNAIIMTDKTTYKPVTLKPITLSTVKKAITTTRSTERPVTSKSVEIASKDGLGTQVEPLPTNTNFLSNLGLGLPKLAGCNIYGRMYRVERIIAELSSACQECRCTELGVQCRSLSCK